MSLVIGVGSVYLYHRQYSHSVYYYLAEVFNNILDTAMAHPEFMDITKTTHFDDTMSYEQSLRYDVFCYKCWGHVEDIVAKNFHKDSQF